VDYTPRTVTQVKASLGGSFDAVSLPTDYVAQGGGAWTKSYGTCWINPASTIIGQSSGCGYATNYENSAGVWLEFSIPAGMTRVFINNMAYYCNR